MLEEGERNQRRQRMIVLVDLGSYNAVAKIIIEGKHLLGYLEWLGSDSFDPLC